MKQRFKNLIDFRISLHSPNHFRSRLHFRQHYHWSHASRRSCEDARHEASLSRSQGRLSPRRQVEPRGVWSRCGGGRYWGQVRMDQWGGRTVPPPLTTPLTPECHLLRMSRRHSAAELRGERIATRQRLQWDQALGSPAVPLQGNHAKSF